MSVRLYIRSRDTIEACWPEWYKYRFREYFEVVDAIMEELDNANTSVCMY